MNPMRENRLAQETSPYLLQHARNPVDWYAWGAEALAQARSENRPILLSIGYSACHWCHVMERESFEDEAIAAVMNRHFVCIKVDREERPDLDEIYMKATLAMNHGQGGWPMTVFLTPDQKPFFAGTYFPPTDRHGRPGFRTVLERLAALWQEKRAAIVEQGDRITDHLRHEAQSHAPLEVGSSELRAAAAQYRRDYDSTFGGFGAAPKFPPATGLGLLLRVWRRFGDEVAFEMVRHTLGSMARGGMYDQIGGGFARYSTDERWLVPHFEKMLYDNALLTRAYLEGYQATGEESFARIAREVCDYLLGEMQSAEGGFFSATDADSEGVEGKFFVWTPAEVESVLGATEAQRLCAWYDISEEGNWEGHSIPHTPRPLDEVALQLGISTADLSTSIDRGRAALYAARAQRVPPGLDDKILTAWNGLAIGALAEAHRVLREPRYLTAATRAADFLLTTLTRPDGGLWRTYRAGKAHLDAYLEDYAFFAEALLDLYEAGGEPRYFDAALRLAERLRRDFIDEATGAFYTTASSHEPLLLRQREAMDGAIPSANAASASVLARLSFHLGRGELRDAAERAIHAAGKYIARYPRAFAKSLAVVDLLTCDGGPVEVALIGNETERAAWAHEIALVYLPNRILAQSEVGTPSSLPLLAGKAAPGFYLCRNFSCQAPICEPDRIAAVLTPAPVAAVPSPPRPTAAAVEATRAHIAPLAPQGAAQLGSTGLSVSRIGFGSYRVDESDPEFAAALAEALLAGCNLIDTSTNYMDGGSERMIGELLALLQSEGRLSRDAVVVVSKIGYVQGQNLQLARKRESAHRPFPEMVKYMDGCWHCIHPEFLADQLGRSLSRLGLETLDVCLLHNPEYFFSDAHHRTPEADLAPLREEFYRRLQQAFTYFETEVASGRIRWYGVSSNTCTAPVDQFDATSLHRMLEAALRAGGAGHHFRVLQLPMNLLESGALLERNQPGGATPLELAAARGIGVLVNRPLNAIRGSGMVRLADPFPDSEGIDPERQARTALWVREHIDPALPTDRQEAPLQQKALALLASTPGVSCVLLGMRRRRYVADALAVLRQPLLKEAGTAFEAFR